MTRQLSGARYAFEPNAMGLKEMEFRFTPGGGAVTYVNDTGWHSISFGYGFNVEQQFNETSFYAEHIGFPADRDFRAFASAAWRWENVLHHALHCGRLLRHDAVDLYVYRRYCDAGRPSERRMVLYEISGDLQPASASTRWRNKKPPAGGMADHSAEANRSVFSAEYSISLDSSRSPRQGEATAPRSNSMRSNTQNRTVSKHTAHQIAVRAKSRNQR